VDWKRTESSKNYVMSDGTTQRELSISPLHYRDPKGKWQSIDTQVIGGDGDDPFENAKNKFHSRFGKSWETSSM
jgi:hypothetical protein